MTEVLVTKKIPGARPGAVLPLDDRLQKHVDAGNAEILPNPHEAWRDEAQAAPEPVRVHTLSGTGTIDDYDELTGPGEKGPEQLTDEELEAATAPDDEDD